MVLSVCSVSAVSEAKFVSAFDSIAKVVEQAASLPDHRERPVEPLVVTLYSAADEVTVTVEDGVVRSMRLDHLWMEGADPDDVADLIVEVVNACVREWNRQHLEQIMSVTPDMRELSAAIQGARDQLDDAWVASLAEARVPRP